MKGRAKAKLLVSVRTADEAHEALAGGADLIDVKEPIRGPMGAADAGIIRDVLAVVDGQAPVSAALGEWVDWKPSVLPDGLSYVKWGLAGHKSVDTQALLRIRLTECAPFPVLVAYADHERAGSPNAACLAAEAVRHRFPAILLDTAIKDGSNLLDWIEPARIERIRFDLADGGVAVAFAGSLDETTIRALAPLGPNWFAVRGAACNGGRTGNVCAEKVRRLREVIWEAEADVAG
jgi:(5-formylfuran-3-yl)methyl phosphate synthase